MATAELLLTAEEYAGSPDRSRLTELLKGQIVAMNMPYPRHGQICLNVGAMIREFVKAHELGRVVSNDSGVITERNPDTVRGADIAYYSYSRVPQGPVKSGYWSALPELVFEVRSPSDRWPDLLTKVAEYLNAGVLSVCVLDEAGETATVYTSDKPEITLDSSATLVFPDVLPGFSIQVAKFFE